MQTDCHGAALCAHRQPWMPKNSSKSHPEGLGLCVCNTQFGLHGYDCDEWCEHAVAILVINLFVSVIALSILLRSLYLLFSLIKRKRFKRASEHCLNPVVITLMFTSIGPACLIAAAIVAMNLALRFGQTFVLAATDGGSSIRKTPPIGMDFANSFMFGLGYCLTVCSFVVLPLTWVGDSYSQPKALKTEKRMRTNIRR